MKPATPRRSRTSALGAQSRPSREATLILARLRSADRSAAQLAKELSPFLSQLPSIAACQSKLDGELRSLETAKHVRRSGRSKWEITKAGRAALARGLGFTPTSGVDWSSLKTQLAAAVFRSDPRSRSKPSADPDTLQAAILNRECQLGLRGNPTLAQIQGPLGWKALGVTTKKPFNTETVLAWALSRMLGLQREVSAPEAMRLLAAVKLGARRAGVDGLQEKLLASWVSGEGPRTPEKPTEAPPLGLRDFARLVEAAAHRCSRGRFGADKVFIAAVWDEAELELRPRGIDAARFKELLVEANRSDLVALDRADLAPAMDPTDVERSVIRHGSASFHFIRLRRSAS